MAQNGLLNDFDLGIVKVPLGFIRVLELPFSILAFATTSGYSGCAHYNLNCTKTAATTTGKVCWSYPFNLYNEVLTQCDGATKQLSTEGLASPSQFFVATGVLSFLYCLIVLYMYTCQLRMYENDPRIPILDLGVTVVLAFFWFVGSCAWATGTTALKGATSVDHIVTLIGPNYKGLTKTGQWNYAALNISLLVGFGCVILWGVNCWFIFKETAWFKQRQAGQMPPPGAGAGTGVYGGSPSTPGASYPGAGHPNQPFPS